MNLFDCIQLSGSNEVVSETHNWNGVNSGSPTIGQLIVTMPPIISGVEKVNFGTKHQNLGTEGTVSGNTGKIMIEYINQKVL